MADMEQIIGDAVNDAGDVGPDDGASSGGGGDSTTYGGADSSATPAATPAPVEEDPFAKTYGLVTRRPDGRENRIPYSKVKAINQHAVDKAKAEWEGSIAREREELAALRAYQKQLQPFESVVDVDGEKLIRALAARNPGQYGRFLSVLEQKQEAAAAQSRAQQDPMPEPDYDLGNGSMTYSKEGFEKLRAWDKREAVREATEAVAKRLQPIEEERAARQKDAVQRQRQRAIEHEVGQHVDKTLERMRALPGFSEHEEAILKAFKADPQATVHDAYLTVMLPKFQQGKTQVRTQVLKEIQDTPSKTSDAPGGAVDEPNKAQSIEDIIRSAVAGLK